MACAQFNYWYEMHLNSADLYSNSLVGFKLLRSGCLSNNILQFVCWSYLEGGNLWNWSKESKNKETRESIFQDKTTGTSLENSIQNWKINPERPFKIGCDRKWQKSHPSVDFTSGQNVIFILMDYRTTIKLCKQHTVKWGMHKI